MINKSVLTVLLAGGLTLSSFIAQAATFNFLQSTHDNGPVVNKSVDGIDLSIGGATFSDSGAVTLGTRNAGIRANFGLGIFAFFTDGDNLGQIDGLGGNDLAVFHFSKKVVINSISFVQFGTNDEYTLYVDDDQNGILDIDDQLGTNFDEFAPNPFDFPTAASHLIGVGAFEGDDDFFISSLDVTAVPVPPSVLLMGSGLLGLAGFSRSRKAKV